MLVNLLLPTKRFKRNLQKGNKIISDAPLICTVTTYSNRWIQTDCQGLLARLVRPLLNDYYLYISQRYEAKRKEAEKQRLGKTYHTAPVNDKGRFLLKSKPFPASTFRKNSVRFDSQQAERRVGICPENWLLSVWFGCRDFLGCVNFKRLETKKKKIGN